MEKKFNRYTYRKYSTGEIIYQCVALELIAADEMCMLITGIKVDKYSDIGVSIEFGVHLRITD